MRWRRDFALAILVGSLLFALRMVYALRPDWAAALTMLPFWAWLAMAPFVLVFIRRIPATNMVVWTLLFLWTTGSSEVASVLRYAPRPSGADRPFQSPVRVVSLNCGGGSPAAAREALAFGPDVVLLQESPSEKEVQTIAKEGGMTALPGMDASILVRGTLEPVALPRLTTNFTMARALLASGFEVYVVSLRLHPPIGRIDLWNPECWRLQTEDRRRRREELRQIYRFAARAAGSKPLIMGGDFNAVANDAVFRELKGLTDAAEECRGPCNTAVNEFPFARIDQVWVRGLKPELTTANRTQNSDHRLVLCDLRP